MTRLLLSWGAGDERALSDLMPLVYDELRVMASRHLRLERQSHTLQRTALVHEAFLRLVDQQQVSFRNRAHFYALASQMMRRVLVDHARKRLSHKGGGLHPHVNFDDSRASDGAARHDPAELEALTLSGESAVEMQTVDTALKRLEQMDPQQGKLVELRFFGGLSIDDTAAVLGISSATVKREWGFARAWLQRELGAGYRE